MTAEQRRRVHELFEAAVDLEPSGARTWVAGAAADDEVVRREVLSLLDHHSRAGDFLATPLVDGLPELFAEDEPLPEGRQIGPYVVVRELGRGGMGRVYLATDVRLGRTVALKALAPHLMRDAAHRERLRREARAAGSLTHPGICTVYALEEIDGELYIATEFVDGRTLRDEIAAGVRPTKEEVAVTARELASALASAHARGVVHRDLKPENIMRTSDGRLKILDFGLAWIDEARAVDGASPRMTRSGVLLGTPAYMAPEQRHGQPVDARPDVFAFGVVMYEYACGVHPVRALAPLAVDAPLGAVIERCMREAPAERFPSAAAVVAALDGPAAAGRLASPHAVWWRVHQIVIVALYFVAAVLAWRIKEWIETPVTVSLFVALGTAATVGGVLRGHLLFTERMNRGRLAVERARTGRAMVAGDLAIAAILFVDGVLVASVRALPAVAALALAVGIALAALVLEPATTAAAFDKDQ